MLKKLKKTAFSFFKFSAIFSLILALGFSDLAPSFLDKIGLQQAAERVKIKEALAAPAIPSYRSSGTFTKGAGAITPPYPTGMAANDICLLVAESENEAISLSTANGFVEVTNSPQFAGTAATNPGNRIAVYWKKTAGGDTAPTVADSGNHQTAQIHCFYNVTASGNPWDITAGGNDAGANDTTGVIPGATTGTANTLVVLIQGDSRDANSTADCSAWTNADLAAITERADNAGNTSLGGGHCMATGEKASAGAYGNTTVTLAGTTYKGAMSIALKPFTPTYEQSAYRLFNNADSADVGTALAAQDTAATLGSTGAAFRLRMLFHIGTDQLPASAETFKLQFAQQSGTCDTAFSGETYADVTAATVIAYNDNATPADGANLTSNSNDPTHGSDTIVNQTYEELNNFTNSTAAIPATQDGKWDFSLKDNGATQSTAYCFRAVKSDDAVLNTYTQIPQITTAANNLTIGVTAGSKTATVNSGDTSVYANTASCDAPASCAAFTLNVSNTSVTVGSIKITETGTANATADLSQLALFYDTDGNYSNGVTGQYGATVASFTSEAATVSGSLALTAGTTYYFYVQFNASSTAPSYPKGGQTVDFQIAANADVTLSSGTATNSGAPVTLAGTTTILPKLTSVTYGSGLSDGSRSSEAITISGYGFGVAPGGSRANCSGAVDTGCVRFLVGGAATVADTDVSSWSNTSIGWTASSTLATYGGASSLEVVSGAQGTAADTTYYIYPRISSLSAPTAVADAAARRSLRKLTTSPRSLIILSSSLAAIFF